MTGELLRAINWMLKKLIHDRLHVMSRSLVITGLH